MPDTELPYIFDLLYDIKTLNALHRHLTGECRMATSGTDAEIVKTMIENRIPLPVGYQIAFKAPEPETDDVKDAERWRFMIAAASDENGPEASELASAYQNQTDDSVRAIVSAVDSALASFKSKQGL